MAAREMSVARLAKKSGVPSKTIYHWLGGQRPGNVQQVIRVCDALDISMDALFGRSAIGGIPSANLERDLRAGVFEVILRPWKK